MWDTWGKRTPFGYVVLMRIPFASLYFKKADPGQPRTWGIILQRNISHANEQAFWPQNRHAIAGRLTQDMAADGVGCDYHPSLKTHQKMADKMTAALRADLAW